jgi:hypothetical protein
LRLLAFAIACGFDRILTFNPVDFPNDSGIKIVHPADLLTRSTPAGAPETP